MSFEGLRQADIYVDAPHSRYNIGDKSDDFNEIRNIKPVFSFNYICMDGGEFSLNSNLMGSHDYEKLFRSLQEKSELTYGSFDKERNMHFHDLDWDTVTVRRSDFVKCIKSRHKGSDAGCDIADDITAYQFKVFQEARVIGFIYQTVFYIVMLDRGHNAYDRDRSKQKKNAGRKH